MRSKRKAHKQEQKEYKKLSNKRKIIHARLPKSSMITMNELYMYYGSYTDKATHVIMVMI